jgi:hypothetical protein
MTAAEMKLRRTVATPQQTNFKSGGQECPPHTTKLTSKAVDEGVRPYAGYQMRGWGMTLAEMIMEFTNL